MTHQRKNPLPIGRYWLDVFESKWPVWNEFSKLPSVRVERSEQFEANAGGPARVWVLFRVTEPVNFPQKALGFPTIALAEVQSSDDTVQKPPPEKEPTVEELIGKGLFGFGAVLAGALVLSRLLRK